MEQDSDFCLQFVLFGHIRPHVTFHESQITFIKLHHSLNRYTLFMISFWSLTDKRPHKPPSIYCLNNSRSNTAAGNSSVKS